MDSYKNFPRLLQCIDYKNPPLHSDDFRTKPRPICSLVYVKQGGSRYFTEGSSFKISEGEILFIPIGGTYISYWDDRPSELVGFHFSMPNDFEKRFLVQKLVGMPELAEDFYTAVSDTSPNFYSYELFYKIFGKIWQKLISVERHIDPRIRPALDLLELSPEHPLQVGDLARLCNMSESHFFLCFRNSMGRSPMDYRTHLLILRAEQLLLTTELSITEISDRLGFGSETYFRRIFKSQVGVSPREYRKIPINQ